MNHSAARSLPLLLASALLLSGCDGDATDMIAEINAAREGCDEAALKASDEECVQMFERYAEMGEDALESYIGGMKALDEAIRRRGGIQFDTTGLGHAISPQLAPASSESGQLESDRLQYRANPQAEGPSWEVERSETRGGGWGSMPMTEDPADRRSWDAVPDRRPPAGADPAQDLEGSGERRDALPQRRPAPGLRAPERRLDRPWLDADGPEDAYYGGERVPVDATRRPWRPDPGVRDRPGDAAGTVYPRE